MRTLYGILACLILVSTSAFAQLDPTPDGIGIYADLQGMTNRVDLEPNTPLEVYLLMTRPSMTGLFGGWACSLQVPDNVYVWGYNFPHAETFALTNGDSYTVVFPGVPYETVNLLMTFIIMPLDGDSAYFHIGPTNQGYPKPTTPQGLRKDDLTVYELVPFSANAAGAAFALNEQALAADDATFDQVKALFR